MSVVALVSAEPQDALIRYLEDIGFTVTTSRTPSHARRDGTLVWLTEPSDDERTVADLIRSWLGKKPKLRAIVVTGRPVRLRFASDVDRARVRLLPAPVFGWQLVDALRDESFAAP